MINSKTMKALDAVTREEIQEVKNRLDNWGKYSLTTASVEAHIEKIKKQLNQAEELRASGKLSEEEAEKVVAILQMRIDSLLDVKTNAFLNEVKMGYYISRLDELLQSVLKLKYSDRYGSDFICRKLHISRATFFRKQDRAFREIALMMRE